MRPNWESELAQFKSAEDRITTELKNKIIERVAKKKRIKTFVHYSSRIGMLSVICLVLFLQRDVIFNALQSISGTYQSSQQSEGENSVELQTKIEDIPLYPGLIKESASHYTYRIQGASILELRDYYDRELEKLNWWKIRDSARAEEDVVMINSMWSNDNFFIELTYSGKEKNISMIEFEIYSRTKNDD